MRAPAWDPLPVIVVCGPRQPDGRNAGVVWCVLPGKVFVRCETDDTLDYLVGKASLGRLLAAVRYTLCAVPCIEYDFWSSLPRLKGRLEWSVIYPQLCKSQGSASYAE